MNVSIKTTEHSAGSYRAEVVINQIMFVQHGSTEDEARHLVVDEMTEFARCIWAAVFLLGEEGTKKCQ